MECFKQADVCFVIDSSGSICENDASSASCSGWKLLLSFITNVIDAFDIGYDQTRVGVVIFSDDASLVIPMNLYLNSNSLKVAIQSLNHVGGQTNTGKALHITRTQCFATANGERQNVPNIAIVMTDGLPTVVNYNTNVEASMLKRESTVLAVGITEHVEVRLLKDISSFPQKENQNYFTTPDFSDLRDILNILVTETCKAPLKTTVIPREGKI